MGIFEENKSELLCVLQIGGFLSVTLNLSHGDRRKKQ